MDAKTNTTGLGERRYTRRRILTTCGISIAGASAAGCDVLSTDPAASKKSPSSSSATGRPDKLKEAPELARKVKAGELPKVTSRLPTEPMVVDPIDRVGTYGGTWHTAIVGATGVVWLYPTCGYENIVRWTTKWTGAAGTKEIIPNVAKSFHISVDGREYTFKLRPGMKWSDGEPFTADDVVFAQNDVLNNTEIYPYQDPNQPHAERVDKHTVKIVFPKPNSLFLREQCKVTNTGGDDLMAHPQHYLKKFHKKYNASVETLVREANQDTWADLFLQRSNIWQNTEMPTLNPWVVTVPLGSAKRVVVKRNPYFWKTDPEGSQLPYIDQVNYPVISDPEVMLTRALSGSIDMQCVVFNTLPNKPVLARNRSKGNYEFFGAIRSIANNMNICLNLTHKDPVKRKIFGNRDFRIALSYAMNRKEIIATAYQGQGSPWQQAPPQESPFYDEEMARQYSEHSPSKAIAHLEKAGFAEKNRDGVRLGPDGKPIAFRLELPTNFDPAWIDAIQLVRRYWNDVGVDMTVKTEDRSLAGERRAANLPDAFLLRGNGGIDIFLSPDSYFATYSGPLWDKWYNSRGKDGEEPPDAAKRQLRIYDKIKATTDEGEQTRLMKEILKISKEQFWVIGTNLTKDFYGIVKNNFHNVPKSMPYSWTYPTPGPTNPEQYFIKAE